MCNGGHQDIQLSGAVASTSKVATVDTRKGIDMCTSLEIICALAVVENLGIFWPSEEPHLFSFRI
jgi:hypothetical protein